LTSSYVPLESLVQVITKGTTPTNEQGYEEAGINFIRALSIDENGILDKSTFLKISEETNHDLRRSILKPGDVLYTIAGVIGRVAVVKEEDLPANLNQAVAIIRPKQDKISPRYLANLLRSHDAQFYLKSRVVESVQANLSLTELRKFPIEVLSLEQQKERNQTLEQIEDYLTSLCNTQTTLTSFISAKFHSWFIDFDPVKAKADGKLPYGMDEETAAMFPDSFEDSELGPIPAGWTWGTLLDISKIWTGGTPKTSESSYWGGHIPWVSGADLSSSELFAFDSERKITSLGVDKSSTKILPVGTVMITARGTVGATKITAVPMAMSQTSFGFKAKKGISDALVYQASQETIRQLRTFAYGAVFDTFTQSTIDITKIALAPLEILQAFGKIVEPLFETMKNSAKTQINLANTLDVLIPRMMSGELKLS
jgi:restriction endonuclease S subunit